MAKFATGSQRLAMEKRGEERMSVTRPVVLASGSGVTRNISNARRGDDGARSRRCD